MTLTALLTPVRREPNCPVPTVLKFGRRPARERGETEGAMDAEKRNYYWTRRTFLREVGLGTLSLAGISTFRVHPEAWAAAKPTRFVYAWTAFDLLDPHIKYDGNAYFFNLNMYDNLLRYQGNPPEIVPWLAESYDIDDDGRMWTFHLRRGVQFHDGSEVNAEAVRFSFERLLTLGKGPSGAFRRMGLTSDRVCAVDSHTGRNPVGTTLWPLSRRHSHRLDRQSGGDQGPRGRWRLG
jgi:hypothetical protein